MEGSKRYDGITVLERVTTDKQILLILRDNISTIIYNIKQKVHVYVFLSQTMNGNDLKFSHVILYAIPRSTVLFSIFNFQVFQLSPFPKSFTSFKLEIY